jgi:major vault protein
MNSALDASLFYASTGPQASVGGGFEAIESAAQAFSNAASERGAKPAAARRMAKGAMVEESRQGKSQEAMVGDVAERKSTYNEPRTLTFANKFRGVPTIRVLQGYAVQVADADGTRKVVEGPATLLLEYAESLDVLSLSTGKPKNTDRLFRTAYLSVKNNKVSDIIEVETIDHVKVRVKLSYNVNFEGDSGKWFTIENYVKHMCDHVRSVLKGRTKKQTIENFYNTATDFIRDNILGTAKLPDAVNLQGAPRPGMPFPENGMRVTDVEVLGVEIVDTNVANLLAQSQQQVVQQNIQLAQAKQRLEMIMANEELKRQEAEATSATAERKLQLEGAELQAKLTLELDKIGAEIQKRTELEKQHQADEAIKNFVHEQALSRQEAERNLQATWANDDQQRWLKQIQAQTLAVADQMKAIDPNLSAALMSVAAQETLAKVAHELSFHQILGGENAVDVLRKVFANTPLEALMAKVIGTAGALGTNGSTTVKGTSPVA